MKIIPLGSSSGQPTLERGVSGMAVFVGSSTRWVLVDCGEGTQQKIMRVKPSLAPSELEAVLITHGHGDHCFGLFSVLATLSMSGRSRALKVVCPPEVQKMAKAVLELSHTHLTYPIEWTHPEQGLKIAINDELTCECVEMAHRAPSHGYLLSSSKVVSNADASAFLKAGFEPGPAMGQAIVAAKRGQPSMLPDQSGTVDMTGAVGFERHTESAFIGGDNMEPQRVARAAAGAGVWVHEATYAHEDWAKDGAGEKWGHSSSKMVGQAAAAGRPGALVLTHFSARYGEGERGVERLRAEASSFFDGPVHLATDLQAIEFAPKVERAPRPRAPKSGRPAGH